MALEAAALSLPAPRCSGQLEVQAASPPSDTRSPEPGATTLPPSRLVVHQPQPLEQHHIRYTPGEAEASSPVPSSPSEPSSYAYARHPHSASFSDEEALATPAPFDDDGSATVVSLDPTECSAAAPSVASEPVVPRRRSFSWGYVLSSPAGGSDLSPANPASTPRPRSLTKTLASMAPSRSSVCRSGVLALSKPRDRQAGGDALPSSRHWWARPSRSTASRELPRHALDASPGPGAGPGAGASSFSPASDP